MKELVPLIYRYADERMTEYKSSTRKLYLRFLLDFNRFLIDRSDPKMDIVRLQDESLILTWLHEKRMRVQEKGLGCQLRVVSDFLEDLKNQGVISYNAADHLHKRYPLKGWKGLAAAIKQRDPVPSLEELRPRRRFAGPWGKQMLGFVLFKRRLGAQYDFEERTLADLDRYLSETGVPEKGSVTPELINGWLAGQRGNSEQTLHTKRRVAEQFFEYAQSLGMLPDNPARSFRSVTRRTRPPYVLSQSQVRDILERARRLPDLSFFPHRGATYEMIFATLYCLGLRVSEACRLCLNDLDLDNGLLLIRESKFYKSRLLPMGPNYRNKLRLFVKIRHAHPHGNAKQVPLFPCRHGKPMKRQNIGRILRNMVRRMDLNPKPSQRGPSVHSFRHAFAVHRLLRWYRNGEDVQSKLPLLSAFLGHVDICSTQVYLQMIPELLEQVHLRFELHCGNHFLHIGGPEDGKP